MKRALRQQIDRTMQTLLKMVDLHAACNQNIMGIPENQFPVVVIGNGDFGKRTNSIHEKIASEIALRFKALCHGPFRFGTPDWLTCCQPSELSKLVKVYIPC